MSTGLHLAQFQLPKLNAGNPSINGLGTIGINENGTIKARQSAGPIGRAMTPCNPSRIERYLSILHVTLLMRLPNTGNKV